MARPKKDLRTRVSEQFPGFIDEVQGLSEAEINVRLSELAKGRDDIEEERDDDEELANAKAHATELGATYRDGLKAVSLKSKFLITILRERKNG